VTFRVHSLLSSSWEVNDTYLRTPTTLLDTRGRTLLHQKSEAFKYLKHLVEVVFKAARVELRHYYSDGAGELTSKETTDCL
jgi:hypothetical protein